MKNDITKDYRKLYSGASFSLGKSFWHILQADSMVRIASVPHFPQSSSEFVSSSKVLSQNIDPIPLDEIHWWVFQQENNHSLLYEKTVAVLSHIQNLKDDAEKLDPRIPKEYSEIISELKKFTDSHSEDIDAFYQYVIWLVQKDPVTPIILFSNQRWSARRNDRTIFISGGPIDTDLERVQFSTEIALGFRDKMGLRVFSIFREMDYENYSRDPEGYIQGKIDRPDLIFRTSKQIFNEFFIFLELLRDSLRDIIEEIDDFNSCTSPIIRKIKLGKRTKSTIRFCLVQLNYSLKPMIDQFGCEPKAADQLKEKIFSSIKIAKENQVDIISFPELCLKKEWVEEILPSSENLIIIGGSYYDNSSNICPIMINGCLIQPEYSKVFPSIFEGIETPKGKMKSGKFVYIYQTDIGTFSVLTCIDFSNIIHSLISENLDFVINPCYDSQIIRFQKEADVVCRNNEITVIQVNRTKNLKDKFGKSSIITKEHHDGLSRYTLDELREEGDPEYVIAKLNGEGILIADINFESKGPTVAVSPKYQGRTDIKKKYRYDQNWISM